MKPSNVVVAYDFSVLGEIVLKRAVALASRAPSPTRAPKIMRPVDWTIPL
ncbi:MAG: hypothetical protein SFX73_34940 [Kofleriaceae bacterium]|nr:hypothetical protein [Kofleriaceae bacterium]